MALKNYRKPKTIKDLRAFLGTVGFYRKFIKDFAKHSSYLTPSTSPRAPRLVCWTKPMEEAFRYLCNSLCNNVVLCVPAEADDFVVHIDASHRGLGATLLVRREGKDIPAAFYSRQLRGAESRYSATELEALRLLEAVRHWSHYLYGQEFCIFTDHKARCHLMTSPRLNKRLCGFALSLQVHCAVQAGKREP